MKKIVKTFKKQVKTVKAHPIIAIGCTLFVVLLLGGLTTLAVLGGGDDSSSTTAGTSSQDDGDDDGSAEPVEPRDRLDEDPPAPVTKGAGTLDVARRVGRFAIAQARGKVETPSGISLRVSAAPKQPVTVDYQLSCYKLSGGKGVTEIAQKRYSTTPPDTRDIPLPLSGADNCTITAGVQLTEGSGRVKVAVLSR
ncbi:MAG: hypothetical protein ACR2LK_10355 [Solirubrobacteraceae bacterium]